MRKTENFNLSQWDLDDRILMNDFNSDNLKIDAALAALSAGSGGGITCLSESSQYYERQYSVSWNILNQLGSWSDWAVVGIFLDIPKFNDFTDGYDEFRMRFSNGDTETGAYSAYFAGNESAPYIVLLLPFYKDDVPLSGIVFGNYSFQTFHATKNFKDFNTVKVGAPPHKANSGYTFDLSRSVIFGIK